MALNSNIITSASLHRPHPFSSSLANSAAASTSSALLRVHCTPLVCSARAHQRSHFQIRQHALAEAESPGVVNTATYTSMRSDPLGFWDTHPGLLLDTAPHDVDDRTLLLAAELQLLANAALDRAEMHSILAQQRDNWNKLFQRMLTSASMTACVLSGLNGQAHSLSLGLPALLLNAGSAAMMAIINQFQPSQLAEEQRTAARLFRKLAGDIHYALHAAPHLRQHTPLFLRDCKRRLQALDKAFPMPLTPGGLEKFPAKVAPPVLIEPESMPSSSADNNHEHHHSTETDNDNNHWNAFLIGDLQRVMAVLDRSDIPKYTGWAQNLVMVNKCLAIAAPLFAASAAVLNVVVISTSGLPSVLGMWAAVCSVLAAFASSFSNDMQLGMVFELYRNSAGYYMDVKTSIEETLSMPIEQRENGTLFRQRIAYQLGRWPTSNGSSPLVPLDAEEAGTLF